MRRSGDSFRHLRLGHAACDAKTLDTDIFNTFSVRIAECAFAFPAPFAWLLALLGTEACCSTMNAVRVTSAFRQPRAVVGLVP